MIAERRRSSFLASTLAAVGLVFAAAGCSHIAPLGPDARPQPSHLRSPLVLEAMRVQPPATWGKCPAGYVEISAPGSPTVSAPGSNASSGLCYSKLGPPVTFTSAAVTAFQPRSAPGQNGPSTGSGLLITLPAADVAELTAVTTTAYDAKGAVDISVDGRTWYLPMQVAPLTHGQFAMVLTGSQARQLQRLLVPSS